MQTAYYNTPLTNICFNSNTISTGNGSGVITVSNATNRPASAYTASSYAGIQEFAVRGTGLTSIYSFPTFTYAYHIQVHIKVYGSPTYAGFFRLELGSDLLGEYYTKSDVIGSTGAFATSNFTMTVSANPPTVVINNSNSVTTANWTAYIQIFC